jgi:hypothetical protein
MGGISGYIVKMKERQIKRVAMWFVCPGEAQMPEFASWAARGKWFASWYVYIYIYTESPKKT